MFLRRQTIPLTFAIEAARCARRVAEAVTPRVDVASGATSEEGRGRGRRRGGTNVGHKKTNPSSEITRELWI